MSDVLLGSGVVPEPAPYVRDVWHDAQGDWQVFHQQWWGSAGAARLQAAQRSGSLNIEQGAICRALDFLDQTAGVVRVLRRLTAAYASVLQSHSTRLDGVVYIGQPGSGRSFLLLFVLLCRMAAAEPVYYTTSQGITYRFDETGVVEAPSSDLIPFDILPADGFRPWSLVDSSADGSMPPFAVTSHTLFKVHMTGVRGSEYKWTSRAAKGSAGRLLDPWSCADIIECLPLCSDFRRLPRTMQEAHATEPAIAAVAAQSGPFLRDVLREIVHPGRAAADIARHLQPLTTVTALFELLGSVLLNAEPAFDALFVRRRDPRSAHKIDSFLVEFRSRLASSCFIAHMRHIGIDRIKTAAPKSICDPPTVTMSGLWTERLLALEESKDDNAWQVSIGILDVFPPW